MHELDPEKVDYVVCTHGHSDHVGNLNMFLNAVHIVSHDVCIGDTYVMHDFKQVLTSLWFSTSWELKVKSF